ncbi:lytic murein transglycosylase B [Ectothiorhodospiraceae bacterium 2226]|nr:lytic murein transglycosylase B [Ectothiorhodospiraceae bacterium 2226]
MAGLFLLFGSSAHAALLERPELQRFIDDMVDRHSFERPELERVFSQTELRPDIIRAMTRPAERRPWHQYRPIFLTGDRINGGVAFWNEHADTLARAEQTYGVPAEIIVAIIGVESRYGRHKGSHRVIDALATLALDYPRRAQFFTSELENYLLMTRKEGYDPLDMMGSYAGAMGKAQFMPSSFQAYAVDFDGDGRRDLWNSAADAIGSVANYLRAHQWQRGGPIVSRAQLDGNGYREVLERGIRPHSTAEELTAHGIRVGQAVPDSVRGALIELETENGVEHWVGWQNFFVITRYNHSSLYAMAVHDLAQAIRAAREK